MRNSLRSVFTVLLLATPLAGLAQQAQQSLQLKPNELATNLPGATTTKAPPKGFDPLTASDQDLEFYGFPPRPNETTSPKNFASWKSAMMASQHRITPTLEATTIAHGPAKFAAGTPKPGKDYAASSYNWSGFANYNGVSSYSASSYYFVVTDYVVPVARQAFGACTGGWDYSSTWTGIDGYGSGDVLQAGSESDAYCNGGNTATYYSAWFEWYPYNETRISNLPIAPGDDMFVEVWNTSSTAGHAYLVNRNSGQYVIVNFGAYPGYPLIGNSAEWIVERPGINGSLATLSNYIADPLWSNFGYDRYYNVTDPGNASTAFTMLDNNGNAISYPSLLGGSSFVTQDEGTAY